MKRSILLGFLLLLVLDTACQVGIKIAGERIAQAGDLAWIVRVVREPLIYAVLACYLAAFLTYVTVLKSAPVGPAYAAAHGHIVAVLLISMLFLGERLSLLQGLGAVAVLAGVVLLAVTETAAGAQPQAASVIPAKRSESREPGAAETP
jgi:multidrug transporter EmrE-like cation transporter